MSKVEGELAEPDVVAADDGECKQQSEANNLIQAGVSEDTGCSTIFIRLAEHLQLSARLSELAQQT